jgi:hypothetical protein
MKIYLLIEKIMNGTVTMDIITTGVEARSFTEAKEIVRNMPNFNLATLIVDDNDTLAYHITPIIGTMKREPLKIVKANA